MLVVSLASYCDQDLIENSLLLNSIPSILTILILGRSKFFKFLLLKVPRMITKEI